MDASSRRHQALLNLMNTFFTRTGDLNPDVTRASAHAAIERLAKLGRTARWTGAVAGWQGMVADPDTELRWALLQGQISVLHAAD